jgi:ketosteroid isomerase-like protein
VAAVTVSRSSHHDDGGRHTWESEFAHIIALRDGRWLHFRDFMNSALTHDAFTRE